MSNDPQFIFSETIRKSVAAAAQEWQKQFAALSKQVADAAAFQEAVHTSLLKSMRPLQEALRRTLADIDFTWVQQALEQAMPPNWRDLDADEVDQVLVVMDETGWCLVWCPRIEIVRGLLGATDVDSRTELLLASKGEVVHDLEECLAGMTHADSQQYRHAAGLAVRAFDDGHMEAAQALAAALITAIINGGFRQPSFAKARRRFEGDPEGSVHRSVTRAVRLQHGRPEPPGILRAPG